VSLRLAKLWIFSTWLLAAGALGVRAGAEETAAPVPRPVFDDCEFDAVVEDGPRQPASALPAFDDSIATIAVTLRAEAEQEATHRWTATTRGSVRLVGRFQKTTPQAAAEIRVLADGKPIWKRSLREGDSIPHACDILVCDLFNGSAVDLVVAAERGSPATAVSAGLQVVPEPYVSRWQVDLPAGYPTFSEQDVTALRQKGQDVLDDIREASKAGQAEIVIPPGDYLFHARWSQASTLQGLADLDIKAEGVTFWFEPPMIHGLLLEDCRNVTLSGLTIDFTHPCWFQARVMKVDRDHNTIRAMLMPGYEPRDAQGEAETAGERAFMFYDDRGRFINHRHTPGKWELAREEAIVLCRDFERSGIPNGLKPGDYIVATIRTGAALRSVRCVRMRFEDINVWSSPGVAVNEKGGEGGNVYRRVRATRRPHTNRLHAFGADVFHLAGTDRGPTLDRCEAAYSGDDILNIHGSFGRVVRRAGPQRYYLQGNRTTNSKSAVIAARNERSMRTGQVAGAVTPIRLAAPPPYEVGDTVEFRDAKSVALLGIAKVVSVRPTPDGPSLPINDRYQAKGEYLVELDRPLDLPELSLAVLDGKCSAAGWVIRNCWFHDDFQRTLINGSPGGLIENTTLQNVGQGICVQFETWGPWMEGPFARDLVIRKNRFLNAPPDGSAVNVSMHPPGGGSNRRRFQAKPVTAMTISENYFGPTSGVPLCIHNVDGLKISGNSVDHPASAAMPAGPANASTVNWLYLQDCENVTIQANRTPTEKGPFHPESAGDD
jgi:hypothetical protein